MTLVARRSGFAVALVIVATSLAGCVGQDDGTDLATPATPPRYTNDRPRPASALRNWSNAFGSKELARLLEESRTDNFDVAAARARILEADALAKSSGAALFPLLNGTESAQRVRSAGTTKSAYPPYISTTSTNYSLGLSASYTLDVFGRNRALADAAAINAVSSRYDRDVTIIATLASVANTWLNLVAAQDRLRVAQGDIKVAGEVLRALRERLAVGTATELDTSQQENVYASQRATVPPLQQTVEQNRNLLAVLIGRTPESVSIQGGSLNNLRVPQPRPGLPSQVLLRRPDVVSAETKLVAEKASLRAARAAFFPTINLTGATSLSSLAIATILNPNALGTSVAQSLAQTIFDGGNLEGQYEQTRGREIELLEDYRKTIVTAFSDVENALIAERLSASHEALERQAVAAARRAYQLTLDRLKAGTIDVTTLLTTQTALFQAEDQLVQVRLTRFLAAVSLFQALGGGFTVEDSPGLAILADDATPEAIATATMQVLGPQAEPGLFKQ